MRSCILIKQTLGLNGACTQISAAYAVLRIPGSRTHTLVVPTSPVEGIESPVVRSALGQELWHAALDARKLVREAVDGRIPIEAVGLAINSANSRTQDQLHIHVDCVQPEVRAALRERASDIGGEWQPLGFLLLGTRFWAIRLQQDAGFNPFEDLSRMPGARDLRDVAAAVFSAGAADARVFLLVAYRARGSQAERLLDPSCGIAN